MPRITREIRGDTLIVATHNDLGEFDSTNVEVFGDAVLHQLEDPQLCNVVIDLTGSDYYGSSALNLFLKIEKKAAEKGGQLLFVGLSPHEVEILRVTGLGGRWKICKSREEALRILRSSRLCA